MAQKQGGGKKARTKKVSQGKHGGGGKAHLTNLELALMGKGPAASAVKAMQRATAHAAPLHGSEKKGSRR